MPEDDDAGHKHSRDKRDLHNGGIGPATDRFRRSANPQDRISIRELIDREMSRTKNIGDRFRRRRDPRTTTTTTTTTHVVVIIVALRPGIFLALAIAHDCVNSLVLCPPDITRELITISQARCPSYISPRVMRNWSGLLNFTVNAARVYACYCAGAVIYETRF